MRVIVQVWPQGEPRKRLLLYGLQVTKQLTAHCPKERYIYSPMLTGLFLLKRTTVSVWEVTEAPFMRRLIKDSHGRLRARYG